MNVELISTMHDDEKIAAFASKCLDKNKAANVEKTIKRCAKGSNGNVHWTPFGMAQISLEYKDIPIPIARQLFKHVIGIVRVEKSRRYCGDSPEMFLEFLEEFHTDHGVDILKHIASAKNLYDLLVISGYKKEKIRFLLPQAMVTTWVETGSLFAYANLLKQRLQPDAQPEIRDVAFQIRDLLRFHFPISMKYLEEYFIKSNLKGS